MSQKDICSFFQFILLGLGVYAGILQIYLWAVISLIFSVIFGCASITYNKTEKRGPGLRERYNKWYHGSSIEKYQKVTAYGKGDYAGYWYMGFVAFCFFTIVTIFPLFAFWYLMAWFNPIIAHNFNQIFGLSCFMGFPQFFYLWGLAYDDYHKKTGKLKSK